MKILKCDGIRIYIYNNFMLLEYRKKQSIKQTTNGLQREVYV